MLLHSYAGYKLDTCPRNRDICGVLSATPEIRWGLFNDALPIGRGVRYARHRKGGSLP